MECALGCSVVPLTIPLDLTGEYCNLRCGSIPPTAPRNRVSKSHHQAREEKGKGPGVLLESISPLKTLLPFCQKQVFVIRRCWMEWLSRQQRKGTPGITGNSCARVS